MEIDLILSKVNKLEKDRDNTLQEGATEFIANVANKIFKGKSFAQSNQDRAQKALDKQSEKDKYNSVALEQGIKVAAWLDKSTIEITFKGEDYPITTLGKTAEQVIEEISNFSEIYQRICETPEYQNKDTSTLKTVTKVLGNAVKEKNSVGGLLNTIVSNYKDVYNKNFKDKGLTAFLTEVSKNEAQMSKQSIDIKNDDKRMKQEAEVSKTVTPVILKNVITQDIGVDQLVQVLGGIQ